MQKKGAIELSVTTIVILIMGITILGLALVFVSNIFGKGTEEFKAAVDVIDKQFIEQLKGTDKVVAVDRPTLEMERATSEQILIAFNNKADIARTFTITPSCSRLGTNVSCAGVDIEHKTTGTEVNPGDVPVQPINFKVDISADKGTYVYNLNVNTTTGAENIEVILDVI